MHLQATPASWWGQDYIISANGARLAELRRHWWREDGAFTIEGRTYSVAREGATGPWLLRGPGGEELAEAVKPSAWRDGFEVRVGERALLFERPSIWRRRFVLREGEAEIGEIRQESIWNRSATIVLPDDLSPPVQLFLTQLMLFLWQREDSTAAVVASSS